MALIERVMCATGNAGKRRELAVLLEPMLAPGWALIDLRSWHEPLADVVEDRDSFEGNAIKKAVEISQQVNLATIADDSGLVVDALGGEPGVYSARWAGQHGDDEANNRKLLDELARRAPETTSSARYVVVMALALVPGEAVSEALAQRAGLDLARVNEPPEREAVAGLVEDRVVLWWRDTVEGRIITERRGEGGFGYDPYFELPELGQTMAEISLATKNTLSHRAKATRRMVARFAGP